MLHLGEVAKKETVEGDLMAVDTLADFHVVDLMKLEEIET